MPRPQYVKDLLKAAPRDGGDPAWQRRMDDAVRFVIGMQERAVVLHSNDGGLTPRRAPTLDHPGRAAERKGPPRFSRGGPLIRMKSLAKRAGPCPRRRP
jgi:hypothetical protein